MDNAWTNSRVRELRRLLRATVDDQWRSVRVISEALRRADDGAVLYRLREMVRSGEAESERRRGKTGRVALHYRRKAGA